MPLVNTITSNSGDSHQSRPWAVITILSFQNTDTVYGQDGGVNYSNLMNVYNYTIHSDILKVTVNSSKANFMIDAEATLSSGKYNYQSLIHPGDHALIWINDDMDVFDDVYQAAASNFQANYADSGLKFVGRVNSVRSIFNTTETGIKTLRYVITFKGFSEFAENIYYNPLLGPSSEGGDATAKQDYDLNILLDISNEFQNYVLQSGNLSIQQLLLFFIHIFLGSGPVPNRGLSSQAYKSSNVAFRVPTQLLSILGLTYSQVATYADMLHTIMGIQKYNNPQSYLPDLNNSNQFTTNTNKFTANAISGIMPKFPDNFNNVTLWSLLAAYNNEALNEMYTSLRMNADGNIVPTYVLRQIPFTTPYINKSSQNTGRTPSDVAGLVYTSFIELPVWIIDTSFPVLNFNIGTSDSMRFNFLQVYPNLNFVNDGTPHNVEYYSIVSGNYLLDKLDTLRNGSRTFIKNTYADLSSSSGGDHTQIRHWIALISDWYMNGHLKLTGQITCAGISAPIAVGDNLIISNKRFHIESISHSYEVVDAQNAIRMFRTTMNLSNGVIEDGSYAIEDSTNRLQIPEIPTYAPGISDEQDPEDTYG